MFRRILAIISLGILVATVAPTMDEASAAGSVYYVKINSGTLNVRKSASTSATVITKLKKGQQVSVSSQSKGWTKITANGKQGYVSSKYIAIKNSTTTAPSTNYRSKAVSIARSNLGVRYLWSGRTTKGFDCSGLVTYSFGKAGKTLPRTAAEMYTRGTRVTALIPGDLMFYATSGGRKVSHVAIYIGNGQMIHSATSRGVSIEKISNSYWKQKFIGAKRI
ncbi:C40 family peptidase [Neobacillus terrae]|uniref:C40 family peptidase n=1 Tax=Neobacillus terrae TaxID=3034837 RepID=UPI00140C106F|nr:C40 family peptidase [Neobacillus terrae]NHM33740.1 SH3 domain-containing protein [Neobacillus terrae]